MSNIDKIRAEIERLKLGWKEVGQVGVELVLNELSTFLDTLPEQPASDFCKENCKGFQETGRCFLDGPCQTKEERRADK